MPYQTEAKIKGLGTIIYVEKPFDKALEALPKGAELITASQLAQARRNKEPSHSLSQNGSYIKEGVLYTQNKEFPRILTRKSPILDNPSTAVKSHRGGEDYFPPKAKVEEILDLANTPNDDSTYTLTNTNAIPTNRFGEEPLTVWLFQENAEEYGRFLADQGIFAMPLWFDNENYTQNQKNPYANQLWLHGFGFDSALVGDYWLLYYDSRVRAEPGEANAKNFTEQNIRQALRKTGFSGLEPILLEELKK